ncbi:MULTISPECIES: heme ABC transporter permease [unclassified Vibrio]|uniref:Heme exporter protein C n=1 Tax=Vibrio sp. HB236076 TaxID=3232307 RepID=A0AB39HD55_9VIBR|nr:heme ABC transporter permease [Vibrio sp. HB161653]MDP5254772.1 heme ABC transporter permease [Vibrio sp. HB161653]
MWKSLHWAANPQQLYFFCQRYYKRMVWVSTLVLFIGLTWGIAWAPTDYQQGDSFRIIYLHVPTAILSMAVYFAMAVCAFIAFVWQWKVCHYLMRALAPLGALMTVLALCTGSMWGKPMWGAWWVWDARLTSELILLFLYLGVIALYQAFDEPLPGLKAAGLLAMIGSVNLPIIHYSVVWWNTLHQGASLFKFSAPSIHSSMLWPLLLTLFGFFLWVLAMAMKRLQITILELESHRHWLTETVDKE